MPPIINFVAKNGFQKQRQISNCESQHFWDDSNIFFPKKIKIEKMFPPDMATESQKTLKQCLLPGYRKQHATLLLLNTFLTQRSVFNISWPLANLLQACYLATYKIAGISRMTEKRCNVVSQLVCYFETRLLSVSWAQPNLTFVIERLNGLWLTLNSLSHCEVLFPQDHMNGGRRNACMMSP